MKKKLALGAIDLLIGLVLISICFIISMKSFISVPLKSNTELKSVQEQVDAQVAEIERLRQTARDAEREILNDR